MCVVAYFSELVSKEITYLNPFLLNKVALYPEKLILYHLNYITYWKSLFLLFRWADNSIFCH